MNEKGFTLIEVIAGIMLIGIAAALLISSGSQWTHAGTALNTITDNYAVVQAIEIVNADYRYRLSNTANPTLAYLSNPAGNITGLPSTVTVSAEEITFEEKSSKNTQIASSSTTLSADPQYVLVTAQKNNSRMVTLLGN